ncbi:TPA: hypothetical protein N0F65_005166, partial [Lagenidium giganteum]
TTYRPRNNDQPTYRVKSTNRPRESPAECKSSAKILTAWSQYFKDATHQMISIRETIPCTLRNTRVVKQVGASPREDITFAPDDWKTFKRKYLCTHGIPPKDRSTGARPPPVPSLHNKKTVKNAVYEHNHLVSEEVFKTYAAKRGVKNATTLAQVDLMIRGGSKRSKIYDFLLEKGENITRKDVDNMIQVFKARHLKNMTDDDYCAKIDAKFAADDLLNTAMVDESPSGHTGVISLSTRHMREMVARFPALVLIDTTHKTNKYVVNTFGPRALRASIASRIPHIALQLCTMMVIDDEGQGQVVQHALFESNSTWHMTRAEYNSRMEVGIRTSKTYDAESKDVLKCSSYFAAEHIESQYIAVMNKLAQAKDNGEDYYTFDESTASRCVIVKSGQSENKLNLSSFTCSCPFSAR